VKRQSKGESVLGANFDSFAALSDGQQFMQADLRLGCCDLHHR
jgi:hypothetical protein